MTLAQVQALDIVAASKARESLSEADMHALSRLPVRAASGSTGSPVKTFFVKFQRK